LLSSPTPEPTLPTKKHKTFKTGDRVVVAYDAGSFYEGVKGTVIKVCRNDVTVDFDKRVRNMDFSTFDLTTTILMHL
jgi:ribosome maturation factor RimP